MSANEIKKYIYIIESALLSSKAQDPTNNMVNEYLDDQNDGGGDDGEEYMEAPFKFTLRGISYQGIVRLIPSGDEITVEYDLNGLRYSKVMDTSSVHDYDDFIQNAKDFIQEINMLKGDGDHFVEELK